MAYDIFNKDSIFGKKSFYVEPIKPLPTQSLTQFQAPTLSQFLQKQGQGLSSFVQENRDQSLGPNILDQPDLTPNVTSNGDDKFIDSYKQHEGFKNHVYKDTTGNLTIGYGHKLTPKDIKSGKYNSGISEKNATDLLKRDVMSHKATLYRNESWLKNQPRNVQQAMEDINYNIGYQGFKGFKKMLKAIQNRNYAKAAEELMNSKYAKQVGKRAIHNRDLLLNSSY